MTRQHAIKIAKFIHFIIFSTIFYFLLPDYNLRRQSMFITFLDIQSLRCRESLVDLQFKADDWGIVVSISDSCKKFLTSPNRFDRLWDPPSLHFNGHRWLFPGKYNCLGMKLTNHHCSVEIRKRGPYLHSAVCFHGVHRDSYILLLPPH
jgi:hypothetical protein